MCEAVDVGIGGKKAPPGMVIMTGMRSDQRAWANGKPWGRAAAVCRSRNWRTSNPEAGVGLIGLTEKLRWMP